jgi:autoinducer 2-degrading protein
MEPKAPTANESREATASGAAAGPRYAITVAFELKPGCLEAFMPLLDANASASVATEPGCLRFDVLRPLRPGGPEVLLYEIYTDRAAFEAHLASVHYIAFDRATRDLVLRKSVAEFGVSENAKR